MGRAFVDVERQAHEPRSASSKYADQPAADKVLVRLKSPKREPRFGFEEDKLKKKTLCRTSLPEGGDKE